VDVLILAGGFGTRMSEETRNVPKPMVLINGKPMLWHIMEIYARQGFTNFIVAGGYRVDMIQEWAKSTELPWSLKVLDTGLKTQTAGRIRMCLDVIGNNRFFLTYGDGLANVSLRRLLDVHERQGRLITVTAVRPPARFGVLQIENGIVTRFGEKQQVDSGWINGGFFVVEPGIRHHLSSDDSDLGADVLTALALEGQLAAYMHSGFWTPMDTLREKNLIEVWAKEVSPPWKQSL
jgi:glucose-1-phosphate cytidylyltransferase